jgi:hypothetical protein
MQQGTGSNERDASIDVALALRAGTFAFPSLPFALIAAGGSP